MRYLIAVALALTLTGCRAKVEERKWVVCLKTDNKGIPTDIRTYTGVAKGNVFVVNVRGTHYLSFHDDSNEQVILDITESQCGIN